MKSNCTPTRPTSGHFRADRRATRLFGIPLQLGGCLGRGLYPLPRVSRRATSNYRPFASTVKDSKLSDCLSNASYGVDSCLLTVSRPNVRSWPITHLN